MIYHYTKTIYLVSILSGGLKPSFRNGPVDKVLWFSTNPTWERTVFLDTAPKLEDAYRWATPRMGGIARVACDDVVAPYRFLEICQAADIPMKVAMRLMNTARRVGANPSEWRGTLETVPIDKFRSIEIYDGQIWQPHSAEEAMEILTCLAFLLQT